MCMMCEQEAMYQAYLDWLAKKEAEEAAAAKVAGAKPSETSGAGEPKSAAQPAAGFICDGPVEE